MSGHKFAIIDPAAGISGDMLLGALIDAGAPRSWLTGLPERLGVPGVTGEIGAAVRCGVSCTSVTVRAPDRSVELPGDLDAHGHGPAEVAPHHHAPHRHVAELVPLVERARISTRTRALAVGALRLLAGAEGRVHGIAPERVSLHEVGAFDALVDIVGGIEGPVMADGSRW